MPTQNQFDHYPMLAKAAMTVLNTRYPLSRWELVREVVADPGSPSIPGEEKKKALRWIKAIREAMLGPELDGLIRSVPVDRATLEYTRERTGFVLTRWGYWYVQQQFFGGDGQRARWIVPDLPLPDGKEEADLERVK